MSQLPERVLVAMAGEAGIESAVRRAGGDTKTGLSRRTLGLPAHAVEALGKHRAKMQELGVYDDSRLVFCSANGTALDSANVRRMFRNICAKAGMDAGEWTPRELRHSFVSLMSEAGVPLEEIARLVGHGSTKVTETVYRRQLRPVLTSGAQAMDTRFDRPPGRAGRSAPRELVPQLVPQRQEQSPSA